MADIQTLKGKITSTIYPNGKGAINAADHQALLLDVADTIADVQDGVSELSQTTDAKLTQLETTTNTKLTELSETIEEKVDEDDVKALILKEHGYFKYNKSENLVYFKGYTKPDWIPAGPWTINAAIGLPLTVHMLIPNASSEAPISTNKFELYGANLEAPYMTWVYDGLLYTLKFGDNDSQIITTEPYNESEGGSYDDTEIRQELTELSAEVGRKQDTISDLANIRSGAEKGATAIQEVKTINGQSIVGSGNIEIQGGGGGGMTTPSGDPMHYLYVTAGAEYNDTGADIERTGVYGDTIVWKNGYWWLNELGDITNDQMRAIFVHWQKIRVSSCYRDSKIRTNLPFVTNISNPTSDARDRLSEMCNKGQFETFDMRVTGNNYESSPNWSNLFIYCYYLKKLLGEIDAPAGEISLNCFFWIEEMRLKGLKTNWSMADSKNFSNASILFAINNEAATSAIVITLRANVYARAMADTEILAALEAHPNVSLASA